jgi:hypothetical protein
LDRPAAMPWTVFQQPFHHGELVAPNPMPQTPMDSMNVHAVQKGFEILGRKIHNQELDDERSECVR